MSNGCGPKWLPDWINKLLFGWFFEASCNKHDEGYAEGGGEARRRQCDKKFLEAMHKDALRHRGPKRLVMLVLSRLYYLGVRSFGWLSFKYTRFNHEA